MAVQQRLFEHYNPLEERVGETFFDELPKAPGVYQMYGRSDELLYVGKAKNLRNRLFTYRRAKMSNSARKTIRLIRMTYRIDIEICNSEKQALLTENELIRTHQPEFNYAKKQPETYYFIGINKCDKEIQFRLQMHQSQTDWIFGAFKGHRLVRKSMGGIIRLLYMLEHEVSSPFHLPSVLTQKLTPLHYELEIDANGKVMGRIWKELVDFLYGQHQKVIDMLVDLCREQELLESFAGSMILDDLESLKWFYKRCSSRNYQIYEQLGLDSPLIPQEKLDDYLIEWVFDRDD